MIQSYEELYQYITLAMENYVKEHPDTSLKMAINDNKSCSLINNKTGGKIVFMLAKFGDTLKVGYAFFQRGQRQPEWIDDAYVDGFDELFLMTLIGEQLLVEEETGFGSFL